MEVDSWLVWSHIVVEKIIEKVWQACEEQLIPCALVNRLWFHCVRDRWHKPGAFRKHEKRDICMHYFGPPLETATPPMEQQRVLLCNPVKGT
jgi:hypothetical protein